MMNYYVWVGGTTGTDRYEDGEKTPHGSSNCSRPLRYILSVSLETSMLILYVLFLLG